MKPNNALRQPAVAVDTLLGISSSPNSRILENKPTTGERGFDSHLQAQEKQRQQQSSARGTERRERPEEKGSRDPAVDKQAQPGHESDVKSRAGADDDSEPDSVVTVSNEAGAEVSDSEVEKTHGAESSQAASDDEVLPDQAATGQVDGLAPPGGVSGPVTQVLVTPSAHFGAAITAEAQIKAATNPINGGFLARSHLQTEGAAQLATGTVLPSIAAPGGGVEGLASVDTVAVAVPVVGTGQAQGRNIAAVVPGVVTDVAAEVSDTLGPDVLAKGTADLAKTASESLGNNLSPERSSPALTTQLAMASAKTTTVSETSLLAQAVNGAVDKMAAAEGVVKEGAELAPIKAPAAVSRLIAPAFTRYQMEGQPSVAQTRVQVPVGQQQWPSAVAERVMWMSSQRVTSAEIHLDPPELGPLQVRVSINQEAASVTFSSQHAAVREALDLGSFRLREMFESEGLDLVNVDVSDQGLAQQSEEGAEGGAGGGGSQGSEGGSEEDVMATSAISSHEGWVDHYV